VQKSAVPGSHRPGFSASEILHGWHGPAMRYAERLQQRIQKSGSRLCVGLDPRPGDGGAEFARNFLQRVIQETAMWAAAFKPNMAYFEAMGIDGIRLLEELLAGIPEDVPVILDAKRSDIGETQKYYAQGYFSGWNVDAVTLNPFLGYDSIEPFLDWEGKGVYLLAVTSNPGSADFQRQKLADGRSVFELVTALGDRAVAEGRKTDVGYVVGLTNAGDVLEKIPDAPLLVPGLGAQGGDLASLAAAARSAPDVINVSRGILYAGDERGFGARAKDWAEKISAAFPG
jgi:orotidine-5'-phosphate decarboxylase